MHQQNLIGLAEWEREPQELIALMNKRRVVIRNDRIVDPAAAAAAVSSEPAEPEGDGE